MDKQPMNPAESEGQAAQGVALLEARVEVEALTQQNDDLLHEVVALRADLSATVGLNERLFGHIIRIIGFVPKSPEEAMGLLRAAFDVAMEQNEDFKARQEKLRASYRERTLDVLRRERETRETEEEVRRIRCEVDALTQMSRAGTDYAARANKLADLEGRLEAAAQRLELMQRST